METFILQKKFLETDSLRITFFIQNSLSSNFDLTRVTKGIGEDKKVQKKQSKWNVLPEGQ